MVLLEEEICTHANDGVCVWVRSRCLCSSIDHPSLALASNGRGIRKTVWRNTCRRFSTHTHIGSHTQIGSHTHWLSYTHTLSRFRTLVSNGNPNNTPPIHLISMLLLLPLRFRTVVESWVSLPRTSKRNTSFSIPLVHAMVACMCVCVRPRIEDSAQGTENFLRLGIFYIGENSEKIIIPLHGTLAKKTVCVFGSNLYVFVCCARAYFGIS